MSLKVPEGALQVPVAVEPLINILPFKVSVPLAQTSSSLPAFTTGNSSTVIITSPVTDAQVAVAAVVKRRVMFPLEALAGVNVVDSALASLKVPLPPLTKRP